MDERAGGRGAVSAATAVAVLAAMLAFLPVVNGWSWWAESAVAVVIAIGAASLARRIGLPAAAAALIGLTTVPLVAALLVVGPGGLLVLDPTTVATTVLDTLSAAFRQIEIDSVPARGTAELSVVMACGSAVVAVVVDLVVVGLRAPVAGMLVVLAVAIVPGRAFGTGTNGWLLLLVAVAALAVVAADRRRRGAPPRLAGLAAGGAMAVAVALVAQLVLPLPVAPAGASALPLFGPGVDPLIRLGENLRRGADSPVLSYRTTARGGGEYLRLAVLEDFTGTSWSPNRADGLPLSTGSVPGVPGGASDGSAARVTTSVVPAADDAIGDRLPLPYPATDVTGVRGDFRWEERGLTLSRLDRSTPVGRYSVVSEAVDTSEARLRQAGVSVPPDDQQALTVPADIPSIIRRTATQWTSGANTPYDIARAIQDRLRSAEFTYDEQTPAEQGYDGDGLGVIAQFLRVKAGYCVHYASTMAVMARLEGIPARIAVGYQPGEASTIDGRSAMSVTSYDLHAWPELYFTGVGWVRFEPTPGRGDVPAYAGGTTNDATSTPTPTVSAAATPTTEASTDTAAGTAGPTSTGIDVGGLLRGAGILLAALLLAAVPGAVRLLLRRRRLRRVRGPGGATDAWQEVLDTVADLGLPAGEGRSPREAETVLARAVGPAPAVRAALGRLRAAYERQVFAPGAARSVDPQDVALLVASVTERQTRAKRWTAALAPRSLLGTMRLSRLAFRWPPPGSDRGTRAVRLGAGHHR